jgi:hypothetical protein
MVSPLKVDPSIHLRNVEALQIKTCNRVYNMKMRMSWILVRAHPMCDFETARGAYLEPA